MAGHRAPAARPRQSNHRHRTTAEAGSRAPGRHREAAPMAGKPGKAGESRLLRPPGGRNRQPQGREAGDSEAGVGHYGPNYASRASPCKIVQDRAKTRNQPSCGPQSALGCYRAGPRRSGPLQWYGPGSRPRRPPARCRPLYKSVLDRWGIVVYLSRHPEAWPRLYSSNPGPGSNRAGSRRLSAWLVAAAGLGLVLVAEYGPDLAAHFIFGG